MLGGTKAIKGRTKAQELEDLYRAYQEDYHDCELFVRGSSRSLDAGAALESRTADVVMGIQIKSQQRRAY